MDSAFEPVPSRLPGRIASRLQLPLIAAPMLRVSGPDLVIAACKAGVVGAFPVVNPGLVGAPEGLEGWLIRIREELQNSGKPYAPFCPNIIMRRDNAAEYARVVAAHGAEMVITSVGSPKPIMPILKDAGILVLADVATLEHARKAIDAGVDGLVLLTAGAGGQTGWLNAFAYVRAVRRMFDGVIVLAGGIIDGIALRAAEVLGCDLAYMGTRFIATQESMASPAYRQWLVESSMDDVQLTKAFNGLLGNYLRPTIKAAGLDPDNLDEAISEARAREKFSGTGSGPKRWTDIRSAGHTVSGVTSVLSTAELVAQTALEYERARAGGRL